MSFKKQVGPAEQSRAEERHVELVAEPAPEHRQHLDGEDGEAPEDEEVHPSGGLLADPGPRPRLALHELLLAERVDQDGLDPFRDVVETIGRRDLEQNPEAAVECSSEQPEAHDDQETEQQHAHGVTSRGRDPHRPPVDW